MQNIVGGQRGHRKKLFRNIFETLVKLINRKERTGLPNAECSFVAIRGPAAGGGCSVCPQTLFRDSDGSGTSSDRSESQTRSL